jgi:hypothetical protein
VRSKERQESQERQQQHGASSRQQLGRGGRESPQQDQQVGDGVVLSTLTVRAAGEANSKVSAVLEQWVRACEIAGDPGNVRVPELLPHYAKLLSQLDSLHSSHQLTAKTVYNYLQALGCFLREQRRQQALQGSSVNYPELLCSIGAAGSRYFEIILTDTPSSSTTDGRHSQAGCATAGAAAAGVISGSGALDAADAALNCGGAAAGAGRAAASPSGSASLKNGLGGAAAVVEQGAGSNGDMQAAVQAGEGSGQMPGRMQQQQQLSQKVSLQHQHQQQQRSQQQGSACSAAPAAATSRGDHQAAAAAPARLQHGTRSTLTVNMAGAANNKLLAVLGQWVEACGTVRDPGNVLVASLLPHHASLLSHLDDMHSSRQLTESTLVEYVRSLYRFLVKQQQTLEDASVDYAAMLSSICAAYSRYSWGRVPLPDSWGVTESTAAGSTAAAAHDVLAACFSTESPAAGLQRTSAVAGRPAQLQGAVLSWTVQEVGGKWADGNLLNAMRKWVKACGISGDPGSVCVAELLPHYDQLLGLLDAQYSSKQLTAGTIYIYLLALCSFLRAHQHVLQSSSVEYAAMLSSMDAARRLYSQHKQRREIGAISTTAACSAEATAAPAGLTEAAAAVVTAGAANGGSSSSNDSGEMSAAAAAAVGGAVRTTRRASNVAARLAQLQAAAST